MPQLRVGMQFHPQATTVDEMRAAWRRADDLGADSLWTWDHFYPLYGDPDAPHFEGWTLLSVMAADTTRAKLGMLVTGNNYRNPELLADMARTLDHVSGGRMYLGVGAGWFERDYDEYGYEFGTAGSRLADLEQALPRIEKRWAALNPAPLRDIPVLIGGGGEKKTLRYTARHADIWHSFGDLDTVVRKSAILDEWCRTEGRDPSEVERSVGVEGDPGVKGQPLLDAGVTLFTIGLGGPSYDLARLTDWLAWRDEVNASRG